MSAERHECAGSWRARPEQCSGETCEYANREVILESFAATYDDPGAGEATRKPPHTTYAQACVIGGEFVAQIIEQTIARTEHVTRMGSDETGACPTITARPLST
jgi:hypothetical protein